MKQASLFATPARLAEPARSTPAAPEPFSRADDRRRAYAAWVEAGRPWPPPAGLTSAIAGACLRREQPRFR